MEDVIQKLKEKRGSYQEQLKEIEEQIKKLDQALAALQGNGLPTGTLEFNRSATESATMRARTPWP
jgi:chromosome segregation ATPase